jgi:3-hydroxybutyryl-CoA dehydratase
MTVEKPFVGMEYRHQFSFSQEQVDLFAQVTGDTNPLHIDAEYGAQSMFGRRIIHGFLGGSVFTKLFGTLFYADGNVYMKQEMKFLKPMFTEKQYEAVLTVKEIIAEKNRAVIETKIIDLETGDVTTTGEAMMYNKKYYN